MGTQQNQFYHGHYINIKSKYGIHSTIHFLKHKTFPCIINVRVQKVLRGCCDLAFQSVCREVLHSPWRDACKSQSKKVIDHT